jgi:hypothetical protein
MVLYCSRESLFCASRESYLTRRGKERGGERMMMIDEEDDDDGTTVFVCVCVCVLLVLLSCSLSLSSTTTIRHKQQKHKVFLTTGGVRGESAYNKCSFLAHNQKIASSW